jgi:hypothetical protein
LVFVNKGYKRSDYSGLTIEKRDVTRILGCGYELGCEGRRSVGQSWTRWWVILLEDIKERGKTWK